jgi:hypothetical protein
MLTGNSQSILLFEPYQRPAGCPAFAVLNSISKPFWPLSGGAFLYWCHALVSGWRTPFLPVRRLPAHPPV